MSLDTLFLPVLSTLGVYVQEAGADHDRLSHRIKFWSPVKLRMHRFSTSSFSNYDDLCSKCNTNDWKSSIDLAG